MKALRDLAPKAPSALEAVAAYRTAGLTPDDALWLLTSVRAFTRDWSYVEQTARLLDKTRLPRRPNVEEIWRTKRFRTDEIALLTGLSEAEVYNVLAQRGPA
jgi:hypothetical protein